MSCETFVNKNINELRRKENLSDKEINASFHLHHDSSYSSGERGPVKTEKIAAAAEIKSVSGMDCDTPKAENMYCLNCQKIVLRETVASNRTDVGLERFSCECGEQLYPDRCFNSVETPVCLTCDKCNVNFVTRSELLTHKCNLLRKKNSLGHRESVSVKGSQSDVSLKKLCVFICSVCGCKFKRKLFLIKHCRRVHGACKEGSKESGCDIDKKTLCTYCNKRYVRKSDLVRHQLKKHVDESKEANIIKTIDHMDAQVLKSAELEVDGCKIYHCKLCDKNILTKRGYVRHVRIHTGERPFTCHICGKQFRSSADLTRHLRSVHDGIKNYSCDICGRCFANKGTRNDHRRTHTGERPYVCNICGKDFPTANSVYVHRRIHTDYFPYQCTSCDKRFRRRQQLVHHVRTHTGEKPHGCDVCGKFFTVKDELSRHLRTHSLDKPFACSQCGLCFAQKRYLSKHIRTQHGIVIDDML